MRSAAGADWRDYSFEVDIREEDTPAGVVFRATDDDNYYMWQLNPGARRLRPHVRVRGRWHVLKEIPLTAMDYGVAPYHVKRHRRGGRAYFAPRPTAGTLAAILDECLPDGDVVFEDAPRVASGGGMLSYIHKVKDRRNVYFFANSSDDAIDTRIRLYGRMDLERWDPHSGDAVPVPCDHVTENGNGFTRLRLELPPARSVFIVERSPGDRP